MSSVLEERNEYPSMTVEVETPDGVMFYTIVDDENGRPLKVITSIGKAGGALAAWASALDNIINLSLSHGVGINDIIEAFAHTTSDRQPRIRQGVQVRSGPEGIVVALLEYKRAKFRELRSILGTVDDEDDGRAHSNV